MISTTDSEQSTQSDDTTIVLKKPPSIRVKKREYEYNLYNTDPVYRQKIRDRVKATYYRKKARLEAEREALGLPKPTNGRPRKQQIIDLNTNTD